MIYFVKKQLPDNSKRAYTTIRQKLFTTQGEIMIFKVMCWGILILGGILLLIPTSLDAQAVNLSNSEQLEDFLPESTLAAMVIPHFPATSEKLRHSLTTLASIQPLQPALHRFTTWLQECADPSGFPFSDFRSIFQATVAIALLDIGIVDNTQSISLAFPEILFAAEITDSKTTLQHLLEKIIRQDLQFRTPALEFRSNMVQGVRLWIVSNAQFQFAYTFLDHVFLLTTNPDFLQHVIAYRQHSGYDESSDMFIPLHKAEGYRSIHQAIAHDAHDVRVYINIRQLWQKLHTVYHQQCLPLSVSATQRNSLLCEPPPLRSLTWLCSLHENGGHERTFWEMDAQETPPPSSNWTFWPELQAMENGYLISDRLIPSNVLYYRAWQFDSSGWWRRWKRYFDLFLPASSQEEISRQIQQLEQTLGRQVESEILSAFGNEMAIACYDPSRWLHMRGQKASSENFPCSLMIRLRQREPIEHLIQSIAAIPVSSITVQDIPVYQLDFSGTMTPIKLYTAFIQDFLTITSSQRSLQQILTVAQQGGSLASLSEYTALSALCPETCYAKSYFNLRYFLQRADLLPTSVSATVPTLPDSINGILSVTTRTPLGVLTESFSAIGGTAIGTGIVLFCALTLWGW